MFHHQIIRNQVRSISSSASCMARYKSSQFKDLTKIKLRQPVAPTHKNFDVSPDHPLWQFFANGSNSQYSYRTDDEMDASSRSWTMAELRRKSFDDLHKLWYLILKERNIVATEQRLSLAIERAAANGLDNLDEKLSLSQKRIKQVLLERQVAYERAQTLTSDIEEYLNSFETEYVNAEENDVAEINTKLVRLQYALFGIHPTLDDYDLQQDINEKFVDGIGYIARIKCARYLKQTQDADLLPLNGVMEQLPFLVRDTEQAVKEVKALREAGQSVKLDKIDTFPFLRSALSSVIEEQYQE